MYLPMQIGMHTGCIISHCLGNQKKKRLPLTPYIAMFCSPSQNRWLGTESHIARYENTLSKQLNSYCWLSAGLWRQQCHRRCNDKPCHRHVVWNGFGCSRVTEKWLATNKISWWHSWLSATSRVYIDLARALILCGWLLFRGQSKVEAGEYVKMAGFQAVPDISK